MKKMSKLGKSVLLSTLAILAFGSVAAGTTYALFSSSEKTNVTVTAGKVLVKPTFTAKLYSPHSINLDGTIANSKNEASPSTRPVTVGKSGKFMNGGTVTVTENGLAIKNMTAGDKVTLTVNLENLCTVNAKYRQRLVFDKDTDFDAVMENVKITENSQFGFNSGVWNELKIGNELKSFDLTVEIPTTAKGGIDSFGFSLYFDAIQANANTSNSFVNGVFNLDNILLMRADHGIEVSSGTKTIEGNGIVRARKADGGKYANAVDVTNGAHAIINSGYFTQDLDVDEDSQWDLMYCKKGTLEINGGTFKSATPKWTLNCDDTAYQNKTANIIVKGGKFYKYNPAQSMTEPDGVAANFVADGYKVVQNGDWYEVVKDVNEVTVGTDDKLTDKEVVSGKPNIYHLTKGATYETYGSTKFSNSNVSFIGSGSPEETIFNICSNVAQTGEGGSDYSLQGSDVSFENLTLSDKVKNGDFRGLVRANSLSFTNCIISARESYWGVGDVYFKDCVFEDTGDWNMWAYAGKNFVFDNCTFKTSKGAVNAYKTDKNETTEMTFNNCKFELVNVASSKKPIVQIAEDNGDTNAVTIHLNSIQVTGDFATEDGTYIGENHYVLNKNNKSADHCVVYVDGVLQK